MSSHSTSFPLVTIVVISYNQGRYIQENLDSIKSQTYPNIELIVGDDASADNSVEVFDKWLSENNYPTIHKNHHTQNTGLATMLNECIAKANGKYIKLIAADDYLHPEAIEKCVAKLESLGDDYGMVFTDTFVVDENSDIAEEYFGYNQSQLSNGKLVSDQLLIENKIPALSVILHTEVLKKSKPYKLNFILEDYSKWLELSTQYSIAYIDEKLAYYRRHAENISKLKIDKILIEELVLKAKYDQEGILKKEINHRIYTLFKQKKINGELKSILKKYKFLNIKSTLILNFGSVAFFYFGVKKYWEFFVFIFSFLLNSFSVDTIFFFPFYHTGGAERVHLDIVKSMGRKKSITLFTNYSNNNHFYSEFIEYSHCYNLRYYLDNKYFRKILDCAFRCIGRVNKISTLGCNTMFYYEKLPILSAKIKKTDLIHAFSYPDLGIEIPSLKYVNYLNQRIVINQKSKQDFEVLYANNSVNQLYLDRIVVVNNMVEIPDLLFEKGIKNELEIIYCGRISPEKRVNLIVEIGDKLSQNIHLRIYGPIEKNVKNTEKYYKGHILDSNQLSDIYKQTDILLITSEREGFPMVVMEAMAQGVVCICTNVGGIKEHIQNGINGFLVENNSQENIINTFVEIINNLNKDKKLLKSLSENAYLYAKDNFSKKIFEEKYLKILKN